MVNSHDRLSVSKSSASESGATKPVFISYSRTDRTACIALRQGLTEAGLNVFQDEEQIRVGEQWFTRLEETLQQCSAFVLLIGRDGVQRWVGAEAQVALSRYFSPHDDALRLPIFPILLDEAKPESLPPFLALFQAEKWSPESPISAKLIEAIKARTICIDDQPLFEGCPFLGLSAFGKQDAKLFFGRRKETLEALATLGNQRLNNPDSPHQPRGSNYIRWLQIEGNSGSGKSSLVNAGMLPMIEQGALWSCTGIEHWRILGPMMPGQNPLEKLAEILEQGLIEDPAKRDMGTRFERLAAKETALASTLKNFKQPGGAFLLVIDQFEELFTFAGDAARKQFDALLAHALQDTECPLFLISTVRADFLERFEYLPCLQAIYNHRCKRYFLPLISEQGLREIIEQPARLAGLDVSDVTTAILADTKDEVGALPLVENGLFTLWKELQDHPPGRKKLSGDFYRQQNGIAGMLSQQADALLERVALKHPKGKHAALELLLALTSINTDGRNTRRRITREEAIAVAGEGDDKLGEQVVRMLSGERAVDVPSESRDPVLRLVTLKQEGEHQQQYVDLIHETLIRARALQDQKLEKLTGYWPTLYDYIEKNRDRDLYRQELVHESKRWQQSTGLKRLWHLRYVDLKKYRALRIPPNTTESRFLAWSRRARVMLMGLLVMFVAYAAESIVWLQQHDLPFDMIVTLQRFRLGYAPLPDLTEKPIPPGSFNMGEQDAAFIEGLGELEKHFGVPGKPIEISQAFYLGKTEVTYDQYDYYVWQQHRSGDTDIKFPNTAQGGRGNRPVVNVSGLEATAYAKWLGEQKNNQCHLPTEAEWEYAARAGTATAYSWGDDPGTNHANCAGCGSQWDNRESAPVGSFSPNPLGLYDMSGNVWEWTCSNWQERFDGSEQHCNKDTVDSQFRVLRGGSWGNGPDFVRASARLFYHPVNRFYDIGFRVLCSSPIE
jgi:formylglycine-generating enzyme required for sulfatase activity